MMNHWFLVGRDIMWVCIVFAPIILGAVFGVQSHLKHDFDAMRAFLVAIVIQIALVGALYGGFIK